MSSAQMTRVARDWCFDRSGPPRGAFSAASPGPFAQLCSQSGTPRRIPLIAYQHRDRRVRAGPL